MDEAKLVEIAEATIADVQRTGEGAVTPLVALLRASARFAELFGGPEKVTTAYTGVESGRVRFNPFLLVVGERRWRRRGRAVKGCNMRRQCK